VTDQLTGIDFLIDEVENYTNYELVMSLWSWDTDAVQENESVGLCMRPNMPVDSYASCWMFKTDNYGAYRQPSSYLVDSKNFTPGARLEDMPALSPYPMPGMKGSWMCAEPMAIYGRTTAACARFAPKLYTTEDPSFTPTDDITVLTYLSSRYAFRDEGELGSDADPESV